MINKIKKFLFCFFLITFFLTSKSYTTIIENIIIEGNNRISKETILMFSGTNKNKKIDERSLNQILKNLYNTNFFEDISLEVKDKSLIINVKELSIIQKISYEGIKAKKIKELVFKDLNLKERSSFNEILLKKDKEMVIKALKDLGYYFPKVNIYVENLKDSKVNLKYQIELGDKSKIKKIKFLGNKIYKDRKLKNIIVSEEYKFWKFISGKKFLNESLIELDKNLLRNFYRNKGYYDVEINTSFAKYINESEFELIYNIDAKNKFYFGKLETKLPVDFNPENFVKIKNLLLKVEGEPYSINILENILDEIDNVIVNDEFRNVDINVEENILDDKININFIVDETPSFIVEKINIFGNNVTRESVIRNQLVLDEGDYFNKILEKKSINNLRSLNFFKNVKSELKTGTETNSKVINISVEEKPTGEISAGAGVGSNGETLMFAVKENNYLGKGVSVNGNVLLNSESIKGTFGFYNPNFKNTNKSIYGNIQSIETDRLASFGYKTNKIGFKLGTDFEYLRNFNLGIGTSTFYENIETDSTASTLQKKQQGDYLDTFLIFDFNYDKRNQKFQTSDGFRSVYSVDVPLISETNTLTNTYNFQFYEELFEDNITNISVYLQSAFSVKDDDIKLTERLFIPSKRLRGFERGKIGPKDGNDFIGGNYLSAVNVSSTVPQILENAQNIDFLIFLDAANLWGVDYSDTLDDGSKLRSAIGVGIDWNTAIGPMSFSLSEPITKSSTDITESFRFNIGTTF